MAHRSQQQVVHVARITNSGHSSAYNKQLTGMDASGSLLRSPGKLNRLYGSNRSSSGDLCDALRVLYQKGQRTSRLSDRRKGGVGTRASSGRVDTVRSIRGKVSMKTE